MEWVAIYSQTGSEIKAISEKTGVIPSLLITNNIKKTSPSVLEWIRKNNIKVYCLPFNPTPLDYNKMGGVILLHAKKPIITLNGFLRIIPPDICAAFRNDMFNGHPGLINVYPELKGKDPQERAFQAKHKLVGSVVHKVVPEVDEGEVLFSTSSFVPDSATLDDYYSILKETSLQAWVQFFQNKR